MGTKEKKKYLVIFSYCIDVEAKNETEAYDKAARLWDVIMPRTDEMNYEIEEVDEMIYKTEEVVE